MITMVLKYNQPWQKQGVTNSSNTNENISAGKHELY